MGKPLLSGVIRKIHRRPGGLASGLTIWSSAGEREYPLDPAIAPAFADPVVGNNLWFATDPAGAIREYSFEAPYGTPGALWQERARAIREKKTEKLLERLERQVYRDMPGDVIGVDSGDIAMYSVASDASGLTIYRGTLDGKIEEHGHVRDAGELIDQYDGLFDDEVDLHDLPDVDRGPFQDRYWEDARARLEGVYLGSPGEDSAELSIQRLSDDRWVIHRVSEPESYDQHADSWDSYAQWTVRRDEIGRSLEDAGFRVRRLIEELRTDPDPDSQALFSALASGGADAT